MFRDVRLCEGTGSVRCRLRGVVYQCSSSSRGPLPVLVATGSCVRAAGSSLLVHGGCCVRRHCWVQGVAPGRVLRFVLRFPATLLNIITGRVGSGQPNSYRAEKNKKTRYFRNTAMTAMAMAAAIVNPPRHRYLVAFFQISTTQNRHNAAI